MSKPKEPAQPARETAETFVFPLNTVLFPEGLLPLKIFEQRYMHMSKICISSGQEFGVCLIKEGREVGKPAIPETTGCFARIAQWDMPQLGILHLIVEGTQRFEIMDSRVDSSGLICARVERIPNDSQIAPPQPLCTEVLKSIIEKLGAEHFAAPYRFGDAAWVGFRLAEVLPLKPETKLQLLRMRDPLARLARLSEILSNAPDSGDA